MPDYYYELLSWWSKLRDVVDCDGEHKYIVWNNKLKKIKIDGETVFHKGIKYTEEFLHGKANIDSFNTVREERLLNSSFLWTWTGFRQAIPLNLHIHLLSVLFLIAKTLNVVTTIVF